jgi:hypothetical protein
MPSIADRARAAGCTLPAAAPAGRVSASTPTRLTRIPAAAAAERKEFERIVGAIQLVLAKA